MTPPTTPSDTTSGPSRRRRRSLLAGLSAATAFAAVALAPTAQAIVNGQDADSGAFPWMVALQDTGGEQFCGGSVIAADRVLTAAHCVEGEQPGRMQVAAGSTRLGDPSAQVRGVARIVSHPDPEDNDIAVLHLRTPFELGGAVQSIALADADRDADLIDHDSPAVVSGWGATSERDEAGSRDLMFTDVVLLGDRQCEDAYGGDIIGEVMVCANHPDGNDSCYGDSGGPLIVRDPDGRPLQVGVVSFGLDACGETAGVYSEVPAFADFIASGAARDDSGDAADADDGTDVADGADDGAWEDDGAWDEWDDGDWDEQDWDDQDWDDADWDTADWDEQDWDEQDWDEQDWDEQDWDDADGDDADGEWGGSDDGHSYELGLTEAEARRVLALAAECLDAGGDADCLLDALDQVWDEQES